MLSTALETTGLAVIVAGATAGVYVLAGLGWALLAAGLVGGGAFLFVGVALSAPDVQSTRVRTPRAPLTNEHVEGV